MATFYVAFWNLENLFDVEQSSARPSWLASKLKKELEGWDEGALSRKVLQLSTAIQAMNNGHGPDILGVCEVENQTVLERLVDSLRPLGRNYGIAHEDSQDGRGIDVAFIFDQAMFEKREQFSHCILKRTATRDLFQVTFRLPSDKELVVIGNHWPSRRGGQYDSEPYRILAGETLAYFHERIREIKGDNTPILVMGDFNDEPFDRSLVQYALSTRQAQRVLRARSPRLLNLMWPLLGRQLGTFYFSNTPNVLDQFLVSNGLADPNAPITVVQESVNICTQHDESAAATTYRSPTAFGRPSKRPQGINADGFSDHFPISLRLVEV